MFIGFTRIRIRFSTQQGAEFIICHFHSVTLPFLCVPLSVCPSVAVIVLAPGWSPIISAWSTVPGRCGAHPVTVYVFASDMTQPCCTLQSLGVTKI